MGVSTDAIIAYGIPLEDGEIPPNLTEEEWEESLEVWGGEEVSTRGYEIIFHCSVDYPMYFLAIPKTELRAWRGFPQKVPSLVLDVGGQEYGAWVIAMQRLGVDTSQQGWYIFSNWG